MTLVSTRGGLWLPAWELWGGGAAPGATGITIDAATDQYAVVFRAPKAGTLGKVRFRFAAVTKDASTELTVAFQGVDATSGHPDGTDDQFRTIPNGSISANTTYLTGLITSDGTDTGTKRTVTKGEVFACVVKFATFVAADSIGITTISAGTRQGRFQWEYITTDTGAGFGKQAAMIPLISLQYDDGSYAETVCALPVMVAGTVAINTGTTPDEAGLRFQVPFDCKVGGAWLGLDADGDFDLVLYDATTGTVVASTDKDIRTSTVATMGFVHFTAEQTLAADTTYVLAVKPTSATSVTLSYADVTEAAEWNQWGGGVEMYYASAKDPTNAGSFTAGAVTTRRPMIGLMITAVDDGNGSGGGSGRKVIRRPLSLRNLA